MAAWWPSPTRPEGARLEGVEVLLAGALPADGAGLQLGEWWVQRPSPTGAAARAWRVGEVLHAARGPAGATLFTEGEEGPALWRVEASGARRWSLPTGVRWLKCGEAVVVGAVGAEVSALDLATGRPLDLPLGARGARTMPWLEGAGLSWWDGPTVYSRGVGASPRVLGTATAAIRGLCATTAGALACLERGSLALAPAGRLLQHLDLPLTSGDLALAEASVPLARRLHIPIRSGKHTGAQLALDLATGATQILPPGPEPSCPSHHGRRLYAAGLGCLDLATGRTLWPAEALRGLRHLLAHPGGLLALADGEPVSLDLDGAPSEAPEALPAEAATEPGSLGPLPFDAVVEVGAWRWGWTYEGAVARQLRT